MHVEFDRESSEEAREAIAADLRRVLSDVRDTVEDWPKMAAQCEQIAAELAEHAPAGLGAEEVAKARGLLEWLAADHFTFLGYREYTLLREDGEDVLRAVPGTGLGPAALRPAAVRLVRPADGRGAGQGARHPAADHHQGQLARHGAPLDLPRLRRRQDVRRARVR